MNQRLTLKVVFLMFACCMFTSFTATAARKFESLPADDDKQKVVDLEKEWIEAECKHDATTLRRILDEKFVASFGVEKPYDKETFVKEMVKGDIDPTESQTVTERNVIIDQDTAVTVGSVTGRGTEKGMRYTTVYRYTVTYIRRRGQWVALAEHLVNVPQAK